MSQYRLWPRENNSPFYSIEPEDPPEFGWMWAFYDTVDDSPTPQCVDTCGPFGSESEALRSAADDWDQAGMEATNVARTMRATATRKEATDD